MINIERYTVIERTQIDEILKEQGLQQTGCTDLDCAVQVGQLLSAQKILVGTVMKLGKKIIISGRIVDIEKGVAELSRDQATDSESGLYSAASLFTEKIAEKMTNNPKGKKPSYSYKKPEKKKTTGSTRYSLSLKKTDRLPRDEGLGNGLFFTGIGSWVFSFVSIGAGIHYGNSSSEDSSGKSGRYLAAGAGFFFAGFLFIGLAENYGFRFTYNNGINHGDLIPYLYCSSNLENKYPNNNGKSMGAGIFLRF